MFRSNKRVALVVMLLCLAGTTKVFGDGWIQRIKARRAVPTQTVCKGPGCGAGVVTAIPTAMPVVAQQRAVVATPKPAPYVAQSVVEVKQSFRRSFVGAVAKARSAGKVSGSRSQCS